MKKLNRILPIPLLLLVLVGSLYQNTDAATLPTCFNFTTDLTTSIKASPVPNTRGDVYTTSPYLDDMQMLQSILEKEGFTIGDSDKKTYPIFGKSTAGAVAGLQNKYKAEILTPQGLTDGFGWVDEKTRQFLNQKYGCIAKALVTLTEPNILTTRAREENMNIKWSATAIPNTATLTIAYVKENGTGTTTIETKTIKNGVGSFVWKIPQALDAGKYKIQVSLSGSIKSDISSAAFEVRETPLEILSQTSAATLTTTSKVNILWKTSTAIKATDKINISLVPVTSTNANPISALYTIIAEAPNTGSYLWTVPQNINSLLNTSNTTYRIAVATKGTNVDHSDGIITITAPALPKVSVTSVVASPTQRNTAFSLVWTATSVPSTAKANVVLIPVSPTGPKITLATGVSLSSGKAEGLKIPETTAVGSYKIALEPLSRFVLDATSVKETNTFNVPNPPEKFIITEPVANAQVLAGSNVGVSWIYENIPMTTPVTVKLVTINGLESNLVSSSIITIGNKIRAVAIPAGTADGRYRLKLETKKADGAPIVALSNEFSVYSIKAQFSVVGTPTISKKTVGLLNSIVSTFNLKAEAFGGIMTKPTGLDFEVVFTRPDGSKITKLATATVSPNTDIASGGMGNISVTSEMNSSYILLQGGAYNASIKSIKWKVGAVSKTLTTGLESFITPSITL